MVPCIKSRLSFLLPLFMCVTANALAIDFNHGELYGSFDTTLSYGQSYRVQSRDSDLIGIANGGKAYSVNGDDGDLNYDTGMISSTMKFTSELELNYKNFGAFVRGTGFKDLLNDDATDRERTRFSERTLEQIGEDLRLLDAYVRADFDIGTMPLEIRAGKQVISWGESTFIQNSINVINPVDVAKLRQPGSELKEALLPVGIVSASLGVSENVSLEGFWQYDYERIQVDPPGSYFSTNDFVGYGGNFAALGFGAIPDYLPIGPGGSLVSLPNFSPGTLPAPLNTFPGTSLSASQSPGDRPSQKDEYGVALRIFAPALNDTEFGLYFINYHSRLPLVNAISTTSNFAGVFSPPLNNFTTPATYFISYPKDIKLFGASFNTQLGTTGWALQGEYSFRHDAPLQVDDVELLAAALHFESIPIGPCAGAACASQLGTFGNGVKVPGFIRRDVSQFQMTATKIWGNVLKANQAVFLGEFAVTHVHDMPDKSTLRLDAPGTNLPGNATTASGLSVLTGSTIPTESNDYADATSWGYRLVGRLTYNNVLGALNVSPRIAWRHDVYGITPGPGGNFIEGNKAITLGVSADYQHAWLADLSYTNFFGAGTQNLLNDRDYVSFSLGYSF